MGRRTAKTDRWIVKEEENIWKVGLRVSGRGDKRRTTDENKRRKIMKRGNRRGEWLRKSR